MTEVVELRELKLVPEHDAQSQLAEERAAFFEEWLVNMLPYAVNDWAAYDLAALSAEAEAAHMTEWFTGWLEEVLPYAVDDWRKHLNK